MLLVLLACAGSPDSKPDGRTGGDTGAGGDSDPTVSTDSGTSDTGSDSGTGTDSTVPIDSGSDSAPETGTWDTGERGPLCGEGGAAWADAPMADVADAWFTPETGVGGAGVSVQVGDLDADGSDDVIVIAPNHGANGVVYVEARPEQGSNLLENALRIETERDYPFTAVVADLDGDGVRDLGVGAPTFDYPAPRPSGAWLFRDPCASGCSGSLTAIDAALRVEEGQAWLYSGYQVGAADLDDDGVAELLVNTPYAADGAGRIYAVPGTTTGTATADQDATTIVSGGFDDEMAGEAFAIDDLDGDGVDDVVLGAAYRGTRGRGQSGAVYTLLGPLTGDVSTRDADAVRLGRFARDLFGDAVATGDVNGDGTPDVVGSASRSSSVGAWVFFGPLSGEDTVAAADVSLVPPGSAWRFGYSVAVGDFDGDTRGDVVVGDLYDSAGGENAGSVQVWWAPPSGTSATADVTWTGSVDERIGALGVGDVDADGRDDLLVGPYPATGAASDATWLVCGR